jgi:hypothetical protein
MCKTYNKVSEYSNQFCFIARELNFFFQLVLKLRNKDNWNNSHWNNDYNCRAIIQNWFEYSLTLLYVLHILINSMIPYWKLNLWAIITCDLLERCIFYMPFCSSLHVTFILSKYFWNLEVSGQTIPS